MAYFFLIFCILSGLAICILKYSILYYIDFLVGILMLLFIYKLSYDNLFYPFKRTYKVDHSNIKTIKKLLSAISVVFIISSCLYITKLISDASRIVFLGAIPIIIVGIIIRKYITIKNM